MAAQTLAHEGGKTFGQVLSEARERLGISRHDLGNKVGATDKEIRAWERGEAKPDGSQRFKLRRVFRGFAIDQFFHLLDPCVIEVGGVWEWTAGGIVRRIRVEESRADESLLVRSTDGSPFRLTRKEFFDYYDRGTLRRMADEPVPVRRSTREPIVGAILSLAAPPVAPAPPPPVEVIRPKWRTFGVALRTLRSREGLSQRGLADLVGVSNATVCRWEQDTAGMIRLHFDKLVDLFPDLRDAPEPDWKEQDKPGPSADPVERVEAREESPVEITTEAAPASVVVAVEAVQEEPMNQTVRSISPVAAALASAPIDPRRALLRLGGRSMKVAGGMGSTLYRDLMEVLREAAESDLSLADVIAAFDVAAPESES
jgi:transcriptional regulator with XRE-family HTH domain